MLKLLAIALCSPFAIVSSSCLAAADDLKVVLVLAGDAYEGPPEFALLADGAIVGKGGVGAPASGAQEFEFTISNGDAVETLSVQFTNDMSVEGKGDRNLIVRSVAVNGTTFVGESLAPASGVVAEVQGDSIAMYSGGAVDLKRPSSGWPEPPVCEAGDLAVIGFANKDSMLAEGEQRRIREFMTKAGDDCRYTVTGYASMAGPKWANDRVSMLRAQTVAAFLLTAGLDKDRVATVAAGSTDQFGSPAENRRVVVQAAP